MERADYSRATAEEREKVIAILMRHADAIAAKRGADSVEEVHRRADALAAIIRSGGVVTGPAYRELLAFLQKKAPG